jgi:hypothetical protein
MASVKTNNHWNVFLNLSDLPPVVVRKNFEWMRPTPDFGYIKYGDSYFHVSEFKGVPARMVAGDWQYSLQMASGKHLFIERSACGEKYKIGLWRGY